MRAMVLKKIATPLESKELTDPHSGPGEIRAKVAACGVCRKDLHVVDGELRTKEGVTGLTSRGRSVGSS
jgi:propanol-preferring alcohol dehydrogenase